MTKKKKKKKRNLFMRHIRAWLRRYEISVDSIGRGMNKNDFIIDFSTQDDLISFSNLDGIIIKDEYKNTLVVSVTSALDDIYSISTQLT